jgi:HNH endonuclease
VHGKQRRVEPTPSTRTRLFAASLNCCAFPGCEARLVTEAGSLVGQACHIKGERPGGPRYDPGQTDDERRSFGNLIALCANHHREIDDLARLSEFTVERLLDMKTHRKRAVADLTLELRLEEAVILADVPCFILSLLVRNTGPQAALSFTFQLGLPFLPRSLCPIVGERRPLRPVVGLGQPSQYWIEFRVGEQLWIRFLSPLELKLRAGESHILAQFWLPTSWYGLLPQDGQLGPAAPGLEPERVVYACPFDLQFDPSEHRDGFLPLELYRLAAGRS